MIFLFTLSTLISLVQSQSTCVGYELLYSNGLSCDNFHLIEAKCNHGGGSCSESTCQRYCDENHDCSHFRSSVLGECQLFRGCTQTRWRAHDANTRQKCGGVAITSDPTPSPSPAPTSVPTDSPNLDCGGYDLIYSNGLSCDNAHLIEMKCSHGGGSCSESTCQRYCDESLECTHFRSSVIGECQIFRGCTQTYWRAHDANTYKKCADASIIPTPMPTHFPTNPLVSESPSMLPSKIPSKIPSDSPSIEPSPIPTMFPHVSPSDEPTQEPTKFPHASPSDEPTQDPTKFPHVSPSTEPSASPTIFCGIFEMQCDLPSLFDGQYTRQLSSNDETNPKRWISKDAVIFEQLPLNQGLAWVFRSTKFGLLVAVETVDDFQHIQYWTSNFIDNVRCNVRCIDNYHPSQTPTYPQPTLSPSKKTRYKIEVEHHLTGLTKKQWDDYHVEGIYIEAMSFLFDVPEDEVEVTNVTPIDLVTRRNLKMDMILVHASVSFTIYKRFQEFRDILQSVKGRASLNTFFNFLLTDENSELDNAHVQHMGIEGDFDMISYFTSIPPTMSPSTVGGAMNVQKEASEKTNIYLVLTFVTAVFVLFILLWRCMKDYIKADSHEAFSSVKSLSSILDVNMSHPEGNSSMFHSKAVQLEVADDSKPEGFVTSYHTKPFPPTLDLERQATKECSDPIQQDFLNLKQLPSQYSGLSESDTDLTVYSFDDSQHVGELAPKWMPNQNDDEMFTM